MIAQRAILRALPWVVEMIIPLNDRSVSCAFYTVLCVLHSVPHLMWVEPSLAGERKRINIGETGRTFEGRYLLCIVNARQGCFCYVQAKFGI